MTTTGSVLRRYQIAVVERALDALAATGSAVVQMPTGSGKTVVATAVVKRSEGPVWFVCHRREISRQATKSFAESGVEFGVVSPGHPFQPDRMVQIVSVQSLARRVADLPAPRLVIWDECHHVAAKSWRAIRNALPGAKHLGLTATPERLDGRGLSDWFDTLIQSDSVRTLIDEGYLAPFRYFAPSEPDLASAKLRAGEYRQADVEKALNIPVLIGDALAEYKKNLDGKRALVFASSVDASRSLAERFNVEGVPALHIDGTTPTEVRDAAVERLAAGEIKVLTNVEVFTEGVDIPAIDAVILLRPTKSLALYLQMVGRALRPAPGKAEAIILDHAGLWLDHDLPSADFMWSLEGDAQKERLAAARATGGRKRRCPECKEVRAELVETCSCGYEFPTGREIGEYDGQLWDLQVLQGAWHASRATPADGWETIASFAHRHGVTSAAVRLWTNRGAPVEGPFIKTAEGDKWVSGNVDKSKIKAMQMTISPASGLESQKAFASRLGVTQSSVWRWKKIHGMPAVNGSIPVEDALEWVKNNINLEKSHTRGAARKPTRDGLSRKEFARTHGVKSVDKWIEWGMPFCGAHVPKASADAWVKTNIYDVASEGQKAFARRLSVGGKRIREWVKSGLPKTIRGRGINIQQGLEWVRDNTKIKIPPEAWPSGDGNGEQPQSTPPGRKAPPSR